MRKNTRIDKLNKDFARRKKLIRQGEERDRIIYKIVGAILAGLVILGLYMSFVNR